MQQNLKRQETGVDPSSAGETESHSTVGVRRAEFRVTSRRTVFMVLLPTLLIMGLFLASFSSFIIMSFQESVPGKAMVTGHWTISSYKRFFTDTLYPTFLWQTLYRSAQITFLTLLLAYPMAYCLARTRSSIFRHIMMLALIIPLLSGGITTAYAWLVLLGNAGLINSCLRAIGIINSPIRFIYNWLGVVISLVYYLLPFAALSLVGPFRNIPRTLEEAALNLGASKLNMFMRIVFPLTIPSIIEAVSLTYALALSAFLFPMMLGGGKVKMMANIIYEAIFVSFDFPLAGMLSTVLLVVSIITVVSLSLIQRFVKKSYD